jgi:hypothetical protein
MSARSMLMLESHFDSLRERLRSAVGVSLPSGTADATRTAQVTQYKYTNAIEPANSLLPSQRSTENLDAAPFTPPVSLDTVGIFVVLSAMGGLIYVHILSRKQHTFRANPPDRIICSHCQYFDNNQFLKCALHPAAVLTEQAVDCIDYDQKAEIKQTKKWRKVLRELYRIFF